MARLIDKLTNAACKHALPGRHTDGLGLYLEVTATGSRYWRFKYRHAGRENRLAFGVFPEVSIAEARQRRTDARALLRTGVDPAEDRRAKKDAALRERMGTFGAVAADWLARKRKTWAPETARKAEYVTNTYLLPKLRRKSIARLETREAAAVISELAETAPNLAAKARQYIGGIVDHAIKLGLREDGKLLSLRGTVGTAGKGHIAAATTPEEIARVIRAVATYDSPVTGAALRMAMLTALRPGVVVAAEWSEIDMDTGEWHIPGPKMKTRHAHIVPLPRQALEILQEMEPYSAGRQYVFPPLARQKSAHLHRDALSNALRRLGLQGAHATHGFRAMLRTAGRERLGIDADVLEAQLGHAKKGEVMKAYDRTIFGAERREAMQRWADYLDQLQAGGRVLPMTRVKAG
jgi:integrase